MIQDQIAYYRARGFATVFVGVPTRPEHGPGNSLWIEQADAASELRADHVSFAILDVPQDPKTLKRLARQVLVPRTSLDWIVEIGRCSRPAPSLLKYLQNRKVAVFHVNHIFTLEFAKQLHRELHCHAPLLLETHDVQSRILCERDERNPWTGKPDDLASLLNAEKALLSEADVLIHCSVDDHRFFVEQFPDKPQFLALPLIDEKFVAGVAEAQVIAPIDILLVGTGHHANCEAVEWFLTKVWPLIESRRYSVRIVGGVRDMMQQQRPDLVSRFSDCFLGRVTDLAPYYRAARSVIAPMLSGGGISVKTIEAFALGMPFIGTTKAYRGFPPDSLAGHGIESHDDPRAFADALLRALSDDCDFGPQGRALYKEVFSKDASYRARDAARRAAYAVEAARENQRDGDAAEVPMGQNGAGGTESGLQVVVLGSSNCIGPASFVEKLGTKIGTKPINLSVGACSSTLGLYQLDKIPPVERGVAFIDFSINDPDVGWNLWKESDGASIIADNIRTIIARLRAMKFFPILVFLGDAQDPYGSALHREICKAEQVSFLDVRNLLDQALRLDVSRASLMKDDYHISAAVAEEVAATLAAILARMNESEVEYVSRSATILQARVLEAWELFSPSDLIDRGSSLRSALYGRLTMGNSLRVHLAQDEYLRAIMINVGAPGGTVAIRDDKAAIVKSMTVYWDEKQPDSFGSILIDFAHPLPGGTGVLVMQMLGVDAIPTERTIHVKPMLAGRYGVIEIEGMLLSRQDRLEFNHTAPVYNWMPLDLAELPEVRQLADRLARL